MPASPAASSQVPVCQLPAGSIGRICRLTGDEGFCQRVREMGISEATLVTKISGSSTSLCLVNGTRIALNHHSAMHILVERLPAQAR
ncbi:MAG TPA: FeoA family protein [Opitutaceae bacterium]|nr:FeoA family protein [Opitutaceae bacterium]